MSKEELRQAIKQSGLTYKQFALRINEYCKEEIITERSAEDTMKKYANGQRNIGSALGWIIRRCFNNK